MNEVFPFELLRLGPLPLSDTALTSLAVSALLVLGALLARQRPAARQALELVFEALERSLQTMVTVDARPIVPLVLTQWLFIGLANLIGLLPLVGSPTRDLAVTAALAAFSLGAGHWHAFRARGASYLRDYLEPTPLLLPLNVVGELSRTLALALRLFGNVLSGELIAAILLYVAGLLLPVPLLLLSVVSSVVQAYLFGVLTLVFTASALQAGSAPRPPRPIPPGGAP